MPKPISRKDETMQEQEQQSAAVAAAKSEYAHKSKIGGQALMEGIMMKGAFKGAMACRLPNGNIDLEVWDIPVTFKTDPKPGNRNPCDRGMCVRHLCVAASILSHL